MRSSHRSSVWHAVTLVFVALLLAAVVLAACTVAPPLPPPAPTAVPTGTVEPYPPDEALADTSWQLYSYADGQGQAIDVPAEARITIGFTADRFGGSAGCNRYNGAYTLDGWNIALRIGATAERACAETVVQREEAYLAALARAAKAMRTEGSLDMLDAAGNVILRYTLVEPLPLAGPTWQVVDYSDGKGGLVAPLPGAAIDLTFDSEGQVTGTAGCNTYGASYEVDATAVTIAPPVATRKTCAEPAGIMEQEAGYLASLSTAATYAIQGDQLTLRDPQGATVLDAVAPLDGSDPATAATGGSAAVRAGKTWQLASYTDAEGQPLTPLPDTEVTIEFSEGRFAGNAGCNQYSGQYTASGGQLSVELGATTRMACPEPVMQQERAYLTALSQAAAYRGAADRLEILDIDGHSLLAYTPAAVSAAAAPAADATPQAAAQLAGPTWQWLETKGGDGSLLSIQDPARYTVEFMEDGTLAVQADCNTGSGTYTAEGSTLRIGVGALTQMACPAGSLTGKFVESLNAAATYVIAEGSLYINMKMDSGDMEFAPAAGQ